MCRERAHKKRAAISERNTSATRACWKRELEEKSKRIYLGWGEEKSAVNMGLQRKITTDETSVFPAKQ